MDWLLVDSSSLTYPPPTVTDQGTEAIMRFLCKGSITLEPNYRVSPKKTPVSQKLKIFLIYSVMILRKVK